MCETINKNNNNSHINMDNHQPMTAYHTVLGQVNSGFLFGCSCSDICKHAYAFHYCIFNFYFVVFTQTAKKYYSTWTSILDQQPQSWAFRRMPIGINLITSKRVFFASLHFSAFTLRTRRILIDDELKEKIQANIEHCCSKRVFI